MQEQQLSRTYSTRFEDHKGLLYKLATQCYGRLRGAGITAMEFEDVQSELNIAYVKASRGFDASLGISFGAYLGRACFNHFNKLAERLELEQFGRKQSYTKRVKRKALDEMDALELEAHQAECAAAAHRPAKKAAPALDDPTRHFGLGLVSLDGHMTDDDGLEHSMLDVMEIEDESETSGLSTVEERLNVKQLVARLRNDTTLAPATRAYVLYLAGAKLSDEGRQRIQSESGTVRRELKQRYGVALSMIRI